MLRKINCLGVNITNASENEVLEYLYKGLKSPRTKLFITTPNPEIIVYASSHPEFKAILNKADVALPDGVGVFIAAGLEGNRLQERIPGVDFLEELCRQSLNNPVSIGFLGGGPGIAQLTAECLKQKYPWINVVFASAEWDNDAKKKLKGSIDILFVAFGFPKQEKWIHTHLPNLPVKAAMGVGGAFDYISGNVPRAPFMLRAMGCEWLFRLIVQPWRIKRQLSLFSFCFLVLGELLFTNHQKKVHV